MRLLFFNRSFWPDVESTGQLLSELCEDLSRAHDVTVVAGRAYNMERFGSWWPVRRERWGRVTILRAFNPRFDKRSFVGRVVNLFSYFCFSFVAGFFARRPDVVIVETDPPVLGLVALFFARLYRAKFVFYLQDLYPDVGVALGRLKNPLLVKMLEECTRLILRNADQVIVVGADMKRRVAAKGCARHIAVIPNWVDTVRLQPPSDGNQFRAQHGLTGKFVVMFSGNLGLSQRLDLVLAAARELPQLAFVFVGEGAAKTGLMAAAPSHVMFLPYQPKEQLSVSLGAADVHLVSLQAGLAGLIVPSKMYGVMAVGRAFIAPVPEDSEVAEVIREHRCGLRVSPDSVAELRAAIGWAVEHRDELQMMGARGRATAERLFDRKIAVGRFQETIEELNENKLAAPELLPVGE